MSRALEWSAKLWPTIISNSATDILGLFRTIGSMFPSKLRGCARDEKSRAAVTNCRAVDPNRYSHSIFFSRLFAYICCKELMSKHKTDNKTGMNVFTKKKSSVKFKPE